MFLSNIHLHEGRKGRLQRIFYEEIERLIDRKGVGGKGKER